MVFGMLVGFFAVVIGVNAVMIQQAISTFGGLETESSYRAGQLFEREVVQGAGRAALERRRKGDDCARWQCGARRCRP
jgi:nitrogen fixation protein FixH